MVMFVKYEKQDQQGRAAFNEQQHRTTGNEASMTPNKIRTGYKSQLGRGDYFHIT
jgi:hypothetical protein